MEKIFELIVFLLRPFTSLITRMVYRKAPMKTIYKNTPNKVILLSNENWSGNDYIWIKESKRRTIVKTRGKVHNLKVIFDKLNKEHFNGKIKAKITWGKYGCRNVKRKRSITFGTYSKAELLIRIHPALDQKAVPEFFVEHVIHHEILHEVFPPVMGTGSKWIIHHRNFRIAEAKTPTYKKAMIWEQKNINIFFQG